MSVISLFNSEYIFIFVVSSIPFYILFYKYNKKKLDFDEEEKQDKKLAYSHKVDLIAGRVFAIPIMIILIIIGFFKFLN